MDDADRAQRDAELLARLEERAAALRTRPITRTHCIDCEEPIPEGRRKAVPGCQRCIECQELHENWRPC
ncbi:MAG: TraR/DksA C4-type zinc finger protein [Desulfuromonadaceae bacterium]|nr:TraR/DksA C4-type zinc finger protein [Desulfuromonadaceae bacterium]